MRHPHRIASWRLAIVFITIPAAIVATRLLWREIQFAPFLIDFAAVILCSWLGGRWLGLTTVVASAAGYYAFPPPSASSIVLGRVVTAFIVVSGTGSWVIARRLEVEDELRRSRQRLSAVMASLPVVLWAVDANGRITLAEGRSLPNLGFNARDLIGRTVTEIVPGHDVFAHNVERVLAGESFTAMTALQDVTIETWHSPVKKTDGTIAGALGVSIDVSDRVKLERQYQQAQKMEAVGQLAAGVAHDFNNLLCAIGGFADLVTQTFEPSDPRVEDLTEIVKAADRAAVLTHQLLAFSRRQMLNPKVLDPNLLLGNVQKLLGRTIGADVEIAIDLAPVVDRVKADPVQLEHVLLNLAVNARDAMPDGGQLQLSTRNLDVDGRQTPQGLSMPCGRYVRLSVADTGMGMPPDVQARVFEPFFTTKDRNKGTGLGLATAYGIIKQSGGFITVDSRPGGGTVFDIYLPAVDAPAETLPAHTDATPLRGGSETILIAEDDAAVRRLAAQILTRVGYTVLEARDGNEALRVAAAHSGAIDLLVTDMTMPGLGGEALASRLLDARRVGCVLFTTGYAAEAPRRVQQHSAECLAKPFLPSQLVKQVRDTLDSAA